MQCLLHHNKDKNTLECPRIHCSCSFTILSFYFYFYFLFLHVHFFLFPFVSNRSFSSLSVLCLYFILSLLLSLLFFVLYDLFLFLVSTSSLFPLYSMLSFRQFLISCTVLFVSLFHVSHEFHVIMSSMLSMLPLSVLPSPLLLSCHHHFMISSLNICHR